jgi:L-lactate dehydrogenase (cytochrome)
MTPVCIADYRELARRRLPKVLFQYIDGGAFTEGVLRRNVEEFDDVLLRQRVLRDVSAIDLTTTLFGQKMSLPVALAPVGMSGLYARRGEGQAARAARTAGVPFCLSTVSICDIAETVKAAGGPVWFQLYMIRDRGYMRELLAEAKAHGSPVLVFTVDLPVPGIRYRDARTGTTGKSMGKSLETVWDGLTHPAWLWDVHFNGGPHIFGNLAKAIPEAKGVGDFWGWVRSNFDPGVTWADIAWVREQWDGPIVIKGVLDPDDARDAVRAGADGLVVSNHGGRQLDGCLSSIAALPHIAEAVGDKTSVLMDGGVRSGLDIVKALALGARACLVGRPWAWALGARGGAGVAHMLEILRAEMSVAMALTGCTDVKALDASALVQARK